MKEGRGGEKPTNYGKGKEVADSRVPLGSLVNVLGCRETRLHGVRGICSRRQLADERVSRGNGLAEGVEERPRLVNIPHEDIDAELAKHGDIELDIDGVRVDVSRDLGRR